MDKSLKSPGFPPIIIIDNIINGFLSYRGLELAPKMLTDEPIINLTPDRIIRDMEQFNYVRIDAKRIIPRGERNWVVILVLSITGKYSNQSTELKQLVAGVENEQLAQKGKLDEIIIVAGDEFFNKKPLTDSVFANQASKSVKGPDYEGVCPFYSAHPYRIFSMIIPEHVIVPLHRIMSVEETQAFLNELRISRSDLGLILNIDPQIIWIGGKEGQVVEITRKTINGLEYYYRRVEAISSKLCV